MNSTLTRHPSLINLQKAARVQKACDRAEEKKQSSEVSFEGCCDNYCVDLTASFGMCTCGFSKTHHNMNTAVAEKIAKEQAKMAKIEAEKIAQAQAEQNVIEAKAMAEAAACQAAEAEAEAKAEALSQKIVKSERAVLTTVAVTNANIAAAAAAAAAAQATEKALVVIETTVQVAANEVATAIATANAVALFAAHSTVETALLACVAVENVIQQIPMTPGRTSWQICTPVSTPRRSCASHRVIEVITIATSSAPVTVAAEVDRPKLVVPVNTRKAASAASIASRAISIAMFASAAAVEAAEAAEVATAAVCTAPTTPPASTSTADALSEEISPSTSPMITMKKTVVKQVELVSFNAALRNVIANASCRCSYLGMRNEMHELMGRRMSAGEKQTVTQLLVATEDILGKKKAELSGVWRYSQHSH